MQSFTIELIAGAFAIGGVLTGVLLQAFLEKRRAHRSDFSRYQTEAYISFLKGVAENAIENRAKTKSPELKLSEKAIAEARGRIAVYGHSTVIVSLAAFLREFGHIRDGASADAFMKVVLEMRKSVSPTSSFTTELKIQSDDISQLLIGADTNESNKKRL